MIKAQLCTGVQVSDTTMMSKEPMPAAKKYLLLFVFTSLSFFSFSQLPDATYHPNIQTVRFHLYGDQLSIPVYNINSNDQLELHFDDLDADVKNYYYTFQLCDYNWVPLDLSLFLYMKGFTQQQITTYRYSSVALTRYTHYQTLLPERGTSITLSGNYMLKVYLNGDTSKLVFTRRMLVLDQKASIKAQVVQPLTPQLSRTHQRVSFTANIAGLNSFSAAQQIKVVILQNNRWDNALRDIPPTFVRGSILDYNNENNCIFPAGKEWRWLDLRSFRLQSDRVDSAVYNNTSTEIFLKNDIDLTNQRYVYFTDLNGMYRVETYETINPYWQGDYATVHFSLIPPEGKPYVDKDIYLAGQLTNYEFTDRTKMIYNATNGLYECTMYLKQGYYNYTYIVIDPKNPSVKKDLETNYWETENTYTILMYYKSFSDRADQLIGVAKINSRTDRPGISF